MTLAKEFPELPGWTFDADEVSAGVYSAFRHDHDGHYVEAKGLDPYALIDSCRQSARDILRQSAGRDKSASDD